MADSATSLIDKVNAIDAALTAGWLEKAQRDELVVACGDPTFQLEKVMGQLQDICNLAKTGKVTEEIAKAMRGRAIPSRPTDAVALLSNAMEKQELHKYQPWRGRLETFERQWLAVVSDTKEHQKELFVNASKNATMSPYGMLVLSYLIYGEEQDRLRLAGTLLRNPEQVLQSHNWFVASKMGDTFLDVHGSKIDGLEYPLFPACPDFSAINAKVMQECGIVIPTTGGAGPGPASVGPRRKKCSAFRANAAGIGSVVGGEPWLQVEVGEDGTGWVDGASINEVFEAERERVQALGTDLLSIRKELSELSKKLQQLQQQQQQQQQQLSAGTNQGAAKKVVAVQSMEDSMALVLKRLSSLQRRIDKDEKFEALKKRVQADLRRRGYRGAKAGDDLDQPTFHPSRYEALVF